MRGGRISRKIKYSITSEDDDSGSTIMENAEISLPAIVFHCCFVLVVLSK